MIPGWLLFENIVFNIIGRNNREDMELWAGFIATEVDSAANMLTPKIGWMVVKSENIKLYFIKKHWPLFLCLTVVVVSILGLIVWIVRKVIRSLRRKNL